MRSKKIKLIIFLSICLLLANVFIFNIVQADSMTQHFMKSSGYNTSSDVGSTVAIVIKTFLSLLSIIFIVLIIYAGFNWMTAAGDEKKVTDAKSTIQRAVIGVIVILAAYVITFFVFSSLPFNSPTNSGGTGEPAIESNGGGSWWDSISETATGVSDWFHNLFGPSETETNPIDGAPPEYDPGAS
jgi:hypothetical protein